MASVENVVLTRFTASVGDFRSKVRSITGDLETMGGASSAAFRRSSAGAFALGAAVTGLTVAVGAFAKKSFDAAARVEELDIAMQAVGAATGVGYEGLKQATNAIRDNGIEMAASQQIALQFAQNQLNLADASKVARVAQDLAVIGAKNSTETTQLLTRAIITGRSELLKSAGISNLASDGYQRYAASIGKSARELTSQERRQATVNLILEEGAKVAGTYEASMETAGKVLRSFRRILNDIQIEIGSAILKGFGPIIKAAYDLISAFSKTLREGGALNDVIKGMSIVFNEASKPITSLLERLKKFFVPIKPYEELKANIKDVTKPAQELVKVADRLTGKQRDLGDTTKYVSDRVQGFYEVLRKIVPVVAAFAAAFTAKAGQSILTFFGPLAKLAPLLNPVALGLLTFVALAPQVQSQIAGIGNIVNSILPILKTFGETLIMGIADGIAQVVNIAGGLVAVFAELLKPLSDFGQQAKIAGDANKGLLQSIRDLRPIIATITLAFVGYKAAVLATGVAVAGLSVVTRIFGVLMAAQAVIVNAVKVAFVTLRTTIMAVGATYAVLGVAMNATLVATTILRSGLLVLQASFITAARAAALFMLKLGVIVLVVYAVVKAAYELYKYFKQYFGEAGHSVDDFVMDIALGLQNALRHMDAFLNNLSRFAANVKAFFKGIGTAIQQGLSGDFSGMLDTLARPVSDFINEEEVMKFDMAGAMEPFIKYLRENKPAGRAAEFVKKIASVLFDGGGDIEETLKEMGDGTAKAAKDAFDKLLGEYEAALKGFHDAQTNFREIFDRPFGIEPSELEKAFGVEGTTQSVIAMTRQLRRAIIDMFKPLMDTKFFRNKAVASMQADMDKQLQQLDDYGRRLYELHARREAITKQLRAVDEEYGRSVEQINDKFDKLDEGAQKNLQRLEKYYDRLIKDLQKTLDASRAAFEKENEKLSAILKERDSFLDKARSGLVGFVRGLNFKSAAAEAAKNGQRAGKVIETTVKEMGNGIRVTIQREVEPAMESLTDLRLTSTDIREQLNERLAALKEFAANIRSLAARGLDNQMLREFVEAGVSGAGDVVSALAGATDAELSEINRIQADLASQVSSFAEFASAQWYNASVAQQEAIVAPLKASYDEAQQAFDNAQVLREAELLAANEQIAALREMRATALAERFAEYTKEKEELTKQSQEIDEQLKKLAVEAYDFFVALGFRTVNDMFMNGKNMADATRQGFNDRFPKLKSRLNELMDRLRDSMSRTAYIDVVTRYSTEYVPWSGPAKAMGGPVAANRAVLVGERGPELFLPNMAGQILPAGETRRALSAMGSNLTTVPYRGGSGGNSYMINVNVPVSANRAEVGREIVDAIQAYERRNGRVYEPA